MSEQSGEFLLDIQDLRTHFHTDDGVAKAVDGVNYSIELDGTAEGVSRGAAIA